MSGMKWSTFVDTRCMMMSQTQHHRQLKKTRRRAATLLRNRSYSSSESSRSSDVFSNRSVGLDRPEPLAASSSEDFDFTADEEWVLLDNQRWNEERIFSACVEAMTLKRSSVALPCIPGSSYPEVIIDGRTLRWPKYEIKNAMFKGKQRRKRYESIISIGQSFFCSSKVNRIQSQTRVTLIRAYSSFITCIKLIVKLRRTCSMNH